MIGVRGRHECIAVGSFVVQIPTDFRYFLGFGRLRRQLAPGWQNLASSHSLTRVGPGGKYFEVLDSSAE